MIGSAFFVSRSIFDLVMGCQRSNFRKIDNFSNFNAYISKTINRSDLKPPPACSPFNSEQYRALLQFINETCVAHSVPEVNSVTLMAKIT